MMLLQTLIAFIVVLGILVVVHELGHYWVARWCGVKVLRFSVGMGKVVWSRRFGPDQTEWALSALPFGGYVKMLDAREQNLTQLPPEELKREFTRQNVWRRIAIVAAGPLANFLLAILIFAGLYTYGIPEPTPRLREVPENTAAFQAGLRGGELIVSVNDEPIQIWSDLRWKIAQHAVENEPVRLGVVRAQGLPSVSPDAEPAETLVLSLDSLTTEDLEKDFLAMLGVDLARPAPVLGKILPGGPAERVGLKSGDLIEQVNGAPIKDGLAFVELIRASAGKPLAMAGTRKDGEKFEVSVVPEAHEKDGVSFGRIQAEVPLAPEMIVASLPMLQSVEKAVVKTWDTSVLTLKMIGKMIVGEVSWKNITGPITIADYAGQTARIGLISYLSFIAFISISLGIMNLLPIPVLDGGLLLYYSLEVLTGRPVSERFGDLAQRAGLGILMTLMIVAMFNDIARLMS
jgi:regulator of sigma E protease